MQLTHLQQAQFARRNQPTITDLCCAGGRYCYALGNAKVTAAAKKTLDQAPAYLYQAADVADYQERLQLLAQKFLPANGVHAYLFCGAEAAWAALLAQWGPVELFTVNAGSEQLGGQPFVHTFERPTLLNLEEIKDQLRQPARHKKVLVYSPVIDHSFLLTHADAFPQLLAFCRAENILLVADERWTALGLTGKWVGSSHHPTQPDVYLLNEVVTDGLVPACLLAGNVVLGQPPAPHLMALAAFEALSAQLLQPVVAETVAELELLLHDFARHLHSLNPDLAVQCIGYFLSVLVPDPEAVVARMAGLGFLVVARQRRVALMPPLTISREQMLAGQKAFVKALQLGA